MRYLIVSDLHSNWEALSAVLEDAAGQYDLVLCCGDVVGYGADPNRVTEWARAHALVTIRGNHDRACASLTGLQWFNPIAQAASRWTHRVLTEENRQWLRTLPEGPVLVEDFLVVHGSPLDEDEYILSVHEAAEAFAYTETSLTFFGHTHVQCGFENMRMSTRRWTPSEICRAISVEDTSGYLINPGSVGQPRDRDPRASYMLFDRERRILLARRVAYDVAAAQQKILDAHLPPALAYRLGSGT